MLELPIVPACDEFNSFSPTSTSFPSSAAFPFRTRQPWRLHSTCSSSLPSTASTQVGRPRSKPANVSTTSTSRSPSYQDSSPHSSHRRPPRARAQWYLSPTRRHMSRAQRRRRSRPVRRQWHDNWRRPRQKVSLPEQLLSFPPGDHLRESNVLK